MANLLRWRVATFNVDLNYIVPGLNTQFLGTTRKRSMKLNLSPTIATLAIIVGMAGTSQAKTPITSAQTVFAESDGIAAVEAEHFFDQQKVDTRAFYLTTSETQPKFSPDGDPPHVGGASNGAYLEILPDSRRNHGEKLIKGTNFSSTPGELAVVSYKINFQNPGRYYVWVRAHSTGSEDNGIHVGLDGNWPDSGKRMQWCAGKRTWHWESKQRTEKQHCGEPYKIFLDVPTAGVHTVHFSMREDGFEFDKFILTQNRDFQRPDDVGPAPVVHAGPQPPTFAYVEAPAAANDAPQPSADANTHQQNGGHQDAAKSLAMTASSFTLDGTGFYLHNGKWAAVNPDRNKSGLAGKTFPFPSGKYHVTLEAVGESDGESTYQVMADDRTIGQHQCPLSDKMFEAGSRYNKTWKSVDLTEGDVIKVKATIASKDGQEYSRARWAAVSFEPADDATLAAAQPFLKAAAVAKNEPAKSAKPATSPTTPVSTKPLIQPRGADGDGSIAVSGTLEAWHKVTLTMNGPFAHEQDNEPNPFTDMDMTVTLHHDDGTTYVIPGYFAADGDAANTSADQGNQWRAHFAPDRPGRWTYKVSFRRGDGAALDRDADAETVSPFDGQSGTLKIAASSADKDSFRSKGRLQYVGQRYLQHADSKEFFLKAGADAPETLLGYAEFDNTIAGKKDRVPLKTYQAHIRDWQDGDPTWADGKGKGLIGAINYLSGKGCNAFSFLTYNAGGDGDNVWPFIDRNDKMHYDCSKLDQWGIVFDHGTDRNMYLHFKMQETEIDDHHRGHNGSANSVPESLDGGNLGDQRKLYCRELIARYGHNLALNWNLGEENTQSTQQLQDMINYIDALDAYDHNVVLHTFPNQQDKQYRPLIGDKSKLTGLSLQNSGIKDTHWQTVKWVRESTAAGKPWVVAFDESGTAAHGQCPDLGYEGYDGRDNSGKMTYTEHDVRRQTLWGHLMGGGAGVEYYFGYKYTQNDLVCEDWRSRDRSWDYCRIALEFFKDNQIAIQELMPSDEVIGNNLTNGSNEANAKYCLANPGNLYLVFLATVGETELDLSGVDGEFEVGVFDPRKGGDVNYDGTTVQGGSKVTLKSPAAGEKSADDWLLVVRRK